MHVITLVWGSKLLSQTFFEQHCPGHNVASAAPEDRLFRCSNSLNFVGDLHQPLQASDKGDREATKFAHPSMVTRRTCMRFWHSGIRLSPRATERAYALDGSRHYTSEDYDVAGGGRSLTGRTKAMLSL
jgi:hypothetical protein